MADQVREVRTQRFHDGGTTVNRQAVSESSADEPVFKAQQVVYLILGILASILTIRILLSLFGANRSNDFANIIYGISGPFVAPFRGLFGYTYRSGVSRFEIETVVAIIVYALLAWGIIKILEITKKNPEV